MSEDDTASPATAVEGGPRKPARRAPELTRGTIVGRYVVLDRLGAGGMGVVYAAWDPELNRRIALKLVQPGGEDASGARMLREAQALARLSHPNVVVIYDVGKIDDRVFLAMELVEGTTLSAWLRAGDRAWREIVDVFVAAGRGLAAAHAAGVIHRDFKPGNVIVGEDGRARVLDFGLARAAGDVVIDEVPAAGGSRDALGDDLTVTGTAVGTPVYMPPEAYTGEPVGEAGDQFSFCVALHEALYGVRPFETRITAEVMPPVRAAPGDSKVPGWLRAVVLRGLARRPSERFASMNALLAALAADPAAKRRRVLAGAAAVVAAGALVAGGLALHASQRADDPCALAAPLAGTWDPLAKGRVAAAFAATGRDDAAAKYARVASALDDAARAWLGARGAACR
ncbi:MAG: serine/threonine-protein kinase, partial [Acidobacteriota bacterium]